MTLFLSNPTPMRAALTQATCESPNYRICNNLKICFIFDYMNALSAYHIIIYILEQCEIKKNQMIRRRSIMPKNKLEYHWIRISLRK